jgi:hypothetical protein
MGDAWRKDAQKRKNKMEVTRTKEVLIYTIAFLFYAAVATAIYYFIHGYLNLNEIYFGMLSSAYTATMILMGFLFFGLTMWGMAKIIDHLQELRAISHIQATLLQQIRDNQKRGI